MAIKNCRECKAEVSTEAKACPRCGAPRPTGDTLATQILRAGLFLSIAAGLWTCTRESNRVTSTPPAQPGIDSRTGRPHLNHSAPIFVLANFPICPTDEELVAARMAAPNVCTRLPADWPVTVMETKGFLAPSYRIRFIDAGGVREAWTALQALRN